MLPTSLLDRLAIVIGAVAIGAGVVVPWATTSTPAMQLVRDGSLVTVSWVNPVGPAARSGIAPGQVVVWLNGRELVLLPQYVYSDVEPTPDPETGEYPAPVPIGLEPAVPTPLALDDATLEWLLSHPVRQIGTVAREEFENWRVDSSWIAEFYDPSSEALSRALLSLVAGLIVLFVAAWWLGSGRAGDGLRPIALPFALATATPFLARALISPEWTSNSYLFTGLTAAGLLPLGMALGSRIEEERERSIAIVAVGVFAVLTALGAALISPGDLLSFQAAPWYLAAGAITVLPGILAAGPTLASATQPAPSGASPSGLLLRSTEMAVLGLTPGMALATGDPPFLFPFALWIAGIAAAGRFTIRPLARLARRAQLQRDLVVAATEAERARVAADIHDDALQELTLLVRRLDSTGDTEGAAIARTVSDRLRAICGDLRLPILDDLGVGPALDWLVLRIERLAGGEVRLERADGTRPPAEVELAFFRVAQEALSNAVKHGRPPIVVRYRTTDSGASLSIDDAGTGIDAEAGDRAEREGHFGLLNMAQRAEGIGAILDVRRWPGGGTHVQLEWRPR